MKPQNTAGICAAIITFQPNADLLTSAVQAILPQVDKLLLIDNASGSRTAADCVTRSNSSKIELITLAENGGIGVGINTGVQHAIQNGYAFFMALDQDSVAAPDMVSKLRDIHDRAPQGQVAACGPVLSDQRTRTYPPLTRLPKKPAPATQECRFLVSSGALISTAMWSKVGLLDADLFMDNLDLDWCFRALSLDLKLFKAKDAVLLHSIGDSISKGRWYKPQLTVHKPWRHYYILRNRILMYRRAYTPNSWIAGDIFRATAKVILTLIFLAPRDKYFFYIRHGLIDGVRGRSGKRIWLD